MVLQLALPDSENSPTRAAEPSGSAPVAGNVLLKLSAPEIDPRLRHSISTATRMLVPKTPVNEYDATLAGKDHIRRARKLSVVEPIPVPHRMHELPHHQFRSRVLGAHQGHARCDFVRNALASSTVLSMGVSGVVEEFQVGSLYSIDQIQKCLGVGNAGGVRVCLGGQDSVRRAVILTSEASARQLKENPYRDRIESDVLVYTGAGREGDQLLGGVNRRIPQQREQDFPIYGFILIGSRRDHTVGPDRWRFLGLLEYLRHYPETQTDARGSSRRVWVFELRIHSEPSHVQPESDFEMSGQLLSTSRASSPLTPEEYEIVPALANVSVGEPAYGSDSIELMRGKLLGLAPDRFEHLVKDLLVHSGFHRVTVTRFSQDGGIDVNAYAGRIMWPVKDLLIQVQAKRWLHTVGRKEVAELRGSLAPYARGAIVTTSQFSRAAISEASDAGKAPIVLVDGYETAKLVLDARLAV